MDVEVGGGAVVGLHRIGAHAERISWRLFSRPPSFAGLREGSGALPEWKPPFPP